MKSYRPELLPHQLSDLEDLAKLYQVALEALTSDRIEEVHNLLKRAAPLLDSMQKRDRQMRESGIPPSRTLSDRTREVLALHRKLFTACSEERRITGEACGKIATSRKFLRGYKPHKKNLGRFLDGEG